LAFRLHISSFLRLKFQQTSVGIAIGRWPMQIPLPGKKSFLVLFFKKELLRLA
jgi:hypothetical protein